MKMKFRDIAAAATAALAILAIFPGCTQESTTTSSDASQPEVAVAQLPAPTPGADTQPDFASPEDAAKALADAVRAADPGAILALLGPDSDEWLFSGDDVADREDWRRFLEAWDQYHALNQAGDDLAMLVVGEDKWPFPAPIVKLDQRWVFDAAAGRAEVTARRVGGNELATIQTLLAILDAQREYAANDLDGDGFTDYARQLISSPGEKDGLYWPVAPGEPPSPVGELIGIASEEGYRMREEGEPPSPYHGYHYRLLTEQGADAPGGAYDYLVNGRLIGGFAVLAYPARYGVSGIMTLMVNQDATVYQADLGEDTAALAKAMTAFNPGESWSKVD
jgi:hypothetical protein